MAPDETNTADTQAAATTQAQTETAGTAPAALPAAETPPAVITATAAPTGFWVGFKTDLTEAEQTVVTGIKNMASYVNNVYVADVQPDVQKVEAAIENTVEVVIPDEVKTLLPYAEQAVAESIPELPLLLSGTWEAFVAALLPLLTATAVKAEAAGVATAKTDVLAAVQTTLASAAAPQA